MDKIDLKAAEELGIKVANCPGTNHITVAEHSFALILAFYGITGTPALLNTSFNLHGEPIVDSIEDAVRTFELSGLDHLWIEDKILISRRK